MKPVRGPEPPWTTRPVFARPPQRVIPPLGPATSHAPRAAFEQALREAMIALRESMAHVDAEADPLAKHLGYRSLHRQVQAGGLDERQLSDAEERTYAHQLLETVRSREAQSFAALDDAAREDLETLLRREEHLHAWDETSTRHAAASRDHATERATAERLQRELERQGAAADRLGLRTRPLWLRVLGALLAVASASAVVLVRRSDLWSAWMEGLPALEWTSLAVALGLGAWGAWLSVDPRQRRAWLLERVERLVLAHRGATIRATRAADELTRAKKLFEQVDDECRREEAAALAVLQRRPGAQRYVSATRQVVVRPIR